MNVIDRFLTDKLFVSEGISIKDSKNSRIGNIFFPPDGDNDPHMHLHSNTLSKGGDIGIKLRDAYYHKHRGCMGEFKDSKCIKKFVDFLDHKDNNGISNWRIIIDTWNTVHKYGPKHCQIDKDYKRPNYLEIKDVPKGNNAHGKRGK